jgi:predicted nucleotidyltransferase
LRPTSDVDLLVLGEPDPHALRRRLRSVESVIGREIDLLAYSQAEFESLVRQGNSLANGIVRGPTEAVIGSLDQLQAMGAE